MAAILVHFPMVKFKMVAILVHFWMVCDKMAAILFRFRIPFYIQTIQHLNDIQPYEIRTCLFEPPLYFLV